MNGSCWADPAIGHVSRFSVKSSAWERFHCGWCPKISQYSNHPHNHAWVEASSFARDACIWADMQRQHVFPLLYNCFATCLQSCICIPYKLKVPRSEVLAQDWDCLHRLWVETNEISTWVQERRTKRSLKTERWVSHGVLDDNWVASLCAVL